MDRASKESIRSFADVLFWGAAGALIIAIIFLAFFRLSPYRLVAVHGPSMEPTLSSGDYIMLATTERIERDQIAVFDLPENWEFEVSRGTETNLIKRVVGLPGDQLTFQGESVTVSSEDGSSFSFREPKILGCDLEVGEELRVPQGAYFLAGDNRVQSFDSMAAWCNGLDPLVPEDTIGINGNLKFQLSWPRF